MEWNIDFNRKFVFRLLLIVAALLVLASVYACSRAGDIGEYWGKLRGERRGKAAGSSLGLTEGRRQGTEDGKTDGLSAKDTEITDALYSRLSQMARLEVLSANVSLTDRFSIGDQNWLYLYQGKAVFTVDLNDTAIELQNGNTLKIVLPPVRMDFYLDQEKTEQLMSPDRTAGAVKAKDGFEAFLNSNENIQQEAEKHIANYDGLLRTAEEAAVRQVRLLAEAAGGKNIQVSFGKETGDAFER